MLVKLPVTLQYAAWGPSLLLTRTVYGLPLIGSVVFEKWSEVKELEHVWPEGHLTLASFSQHVLCSLRAEPGLQNLGVENGF